MASENQPSRDTSTQPTVPRPQAAPKQQRVTTKKKASAASPKASSTATRTPSALPRKRGRLGTWMLLLACLVLPLPALLIELNQPDVFDPGETIVLTTSIQSWDHQAKVAQSEEFSLEQLAPYYNDVPQWHRSPLVTWLHMLAFYSLDDAEVSIDSLTEAARMVSIISALFALASVYWAAVSLGGRRSGFLAAVICAANPFFIYYARTASDIMPTTCFMILGISSALWAMRPLRPMPSFARQLIGWVICGLSTGAAMLAVGPIGMILIIVPVLIVEMICPERFSHLLGLLAALLIGVLLVLPAGAIAFQYDPNAWWAWLTNLAPMSPQPARVIAGHILQRIGLLLIVVLPWTLWLFAAIGQPLSTSSSGTRKRLFLSWSLFVVSAILMIFLKTPEQQGYIFRVVVPLIVVASLLIGDLFDQYIYLASEGRFARTWRLLRWPQILILLLLSIVAGVAMYQPQLMQRLLSLEHQPWISMGWIYATVTGVVLFVVVVLSMRYAIKQHAGRTATIWALWMLILMPLIILPWARGELVDNPIRFEAQDLVGRIGEHKVLWLKTESIQLASELNPAFLLYTRRSYKQITPQQIEQTAEQFGEFLLLSPDGYKPKSTRLELAARYANADLAMWHVSGGPLPEQIPTSDNPASQ